MYQIPGTRRSTVNIGPGELVVHEAGDGPLVILLHGFPELAYSWRHQIRALAESGYRVIAPDQRGYNGSYRPEDISAYRSDHLIADLIALMDATDNNQAAVVGHDWGGAIAWSAALRHPDRVAAVIGVNTPYVPLGPEPPTTTLYRQAGPDHYVLQFQPVGPADQAMAADVRTLFMTLFRRGTPPRAVGDEPRAVAKAYLQPSRQAATSPLLVDDEELDVYVAEFEATGFTAALNWYRNVDANWALDGDLNGRRITQPSLLVVAEWDGILAPLVEPMRAIADDLTTVTIQRCGHWTNQERPDELNVALINWLSARYAPSR